MIKEYGKLVAVLTGAIFIVLVTGLVVTLIGRI